MHIVTVNDYLAQRDADWMGKIYRFLGLTVGVNLSQMEHDPKQERLRGRHHLRHQQRVRLRLPARQHGVPHSRRRCSGGLDYAIVDEVDSILIDEARTPLIISGQAEDTTDLYIRMNQIAPKLDPPEGGESGAGDYWVDEKQHQVILSEQGHEHAEELLEKAGLLPANSQPLRRRPTSSSCTT